MTKNPLALLLALFAIFSPAFASAGLLGVSLGATYPTPLGYSFQSIDHSIGVQAESWVGFDFLDPNLMNLHFTIGYEPFVVRSQSINIHMMQAFAGVQFHNGEFGTHFLPFITVDVGAVYNWMAFTTGSSQNSSYAFATQVSPGFDLPVVGHFGATFSTPFKVLFLSRPLAIWDAILAVRFKL